jgi:hypothetical protein
LKLFKKMAITDEKASKSRDTDLVATAKAFLSAFGIGKTRRSRPPFSLDKIKRYDPDTYASAHALVEMATAAGSRQLIQRDLLWPASADMRDAVKGIWDLARDAKQIEIDGKKISKDEIIVRSLGKALWTLNPATDIAAWIRQSRHFWEKTNSVLLSTKAMLRRTEHWVTAMDGGDKGIVSEPTSGTRR